MGWGEEEKTGEKYDFMVYLVTLARAMAARMKKVRIFVGLEGFWDWTVSPSGTRELVTRRTIYEG
jgi:hypothetical protein